MSYALSSIVAALVLLSPEDAPHSDAAPSVYPGPSPREEESKTSQATEELEQPPPAPLEPTFESLPRLELLPPVAVNYNSPDPNRGWLNFGRALASVGVANALVWQYNYWTGEDWAYVTREEVVANVRGGYKFDGNRLPTNFFSHPYQGSAYFNVARASGLSFWESTPFTLIGSASWEWFGESEAPSTNDLVATTLGGIVLGEILFRLSSDILDDSSVGFERFLREFLGFAVNPARGIERLADGSAFDAGPPPDRRRLRHFAVDVGVDRILLVQDRESTRYEPRPLIALQLEYGDLAPTGSSQTLAPFESFDFYGALNLGRVQELGAQIYAQGLLFGFSYDIGLDEGAQRDNDVLGLVQSFDFRGARVAQFGGIGIGPANIVILRFGEEQRLRIGTDVQWLVIGGSSSPADGDTERGYNYLTGITTGQEFRLEMAKFGEVGFRAKQYAAVVIDGESGEEFIGHTRLWYEVDVVGGLGLGISPNLVHRISRYDELGEIALAQLETQLYARGRF